MSAEIPEYVDPNEDEPYNVLGEVTINNKTLFLGEQPHHRRPASFSLLNTLTRHPVAPHSDLSVRITPIWDAYEIGKQTPLYSDISLVPAKDIFEGKSDALAACTATEIMLAQFGPSSGYRLWAWKLTLSHSLEDKTLSQLGVTRNMLYHGIEEHVGKKSLIPNSTIKELFRAFSDENIRSMRKKLRSKGTLFSSKPVSPYTDPLLARCRPSQIQGIVTITDQQLEESLLQFRDGMNAAMAQFDGKLTD